MDDGVTLADVTQELVAQARALAGTLDQTCNVDKLNDGRRLFIGLPDLGQLVQPRIRHRHDAGVRLDGAERIVGCLRVLRAGQRVERVDLPTFGRPTMPNFMMFYISFVVAFYRAWGVAPES